jgi:hypothetical protein
MSAYLFRISAVGNTGPFMSQEAKLGFGRFEVVS